MRILFLATDVYGGKGGIAQSNRDLLDMLCELDEIEKIYLVVKNGNKINDSFPSKIILCNKKPLGSMQFILLAFLKIFSLPSVVLCGHINYLGLSVFLCFMTQSKLALMAHGIEVWNGSILRALMLRVVNKIWHVSFFTKNKILSWADLPSGIFEYLPNLIHLEKYSRGKKNSYLLHKYELESRKIILTVSRLSSLERYKGHDELIELFPAILRKNPNLGYLIVGDGDDLNRLREKVNNLGLDDIIIFTGYISEQEKVEIYRLADAYVMVGSGEGFGLVYLEALAYGVPVVGSTADASAEVLLNGELGELATPGDSESIIGAIERALQKPIQNYPELELYAKTAYSKRVYQAVKNLHL